MNLESHTATENTHGKTEMNIKANSLMDQERGEEN